jgi:hypothetical protein
MRRIIRLLPWIVLIVLAAVCGSIRPGQATLLECFETLSPERALRASEIAARSACAAAATSDPVMALTIAGISAAGIGGAFSGSKDCKSKINGAVGVLIAEALLSTPLTSELFTAEQREWLKEFIRGNPSVSLTDILNQVGPLGATINGYIECGCNVAGAPADLKRIADEYAASAEACVNFAGDAIAWVAGVPGMIGRFMEDAFAPTGTMAEDNCPGYGSVPVGYWTSRPVYPYQTRPPCGPSIVCGPNEVLRTRLASSGKSEWMCARDCPQPEKQFTPGASCWQTASYRVEKGRCVAEAQGECCGDGQAVFEWGKCSPACKPGVEYYDRKAKRCTTCPPEFHPMYKDAGVSSIGSCNRCPFAHTYNMKTLRCECPPGQISQIVSGEIRPGIYVYLAFCEPAPPCGGNAIRDTTGTCRPCGQGQVAYGNKCVLLLDLNNFVTGKTKSIPAAVPPPITAVPCLPGQTRAGGRCVWPPCPAGHIRQGATCVAVATARPVPVTPQIPSPPPVGYPVPPAQVIPPPGGIAAPTVQVRPGAASAPTAPVPTQTMKPAPPQPQQFKMTPGVVVCPPGTQPLQGKCVPSVR